MKLSKSNTAKEIFDKLTPVSWVYNKKLSLGAKTHFGFIAQDLKNDLGSEYNFVEHDDASGYLKVNYEEFIGILTSVIKTQEQEIINLHKEVDLIKEQINTINK